MSLTASTLSTSKGANAVNTLVLILPDNSNLRAILLLKSELELYASRLQENNSAFFLIKENIYLSLPDASVSEDEASSALNDNNISKCQIHTIKRRRD